MLEAVGQLGNGRARDQTLAKARAVTRQSDQLRRQLAPFRGNASSSPVVYPKHSSDFPSASRASPPCSAPACRSTASR